jgi:hypothetical protein
MVRRVAFLTTATLVMSVHAAFGCFLLQGAPRTWVGDADVIVRALVSDITDGPSSFPIERGEELIRFVILEQLKGETLFSIAVPGILTDRPDMNDTPVPYGMVRPAGRGGGCFARTYQRRGEYLLLLKKVDGRLTPYWASLGATNEQIRDKNDPWVMWVRQQLAAIGKSNR